MASNAIEQEMDDSEAEDTAIDVEAEDEHDLETEMTEKFLTNGHLTYKEMLLTKALHNGHNNQQEENKEINSTNISSNTTNGTTNGISNKHSDKIFNHKLY
uniref:Uncharacterized protein n=1 Tax=Glossina morsitans morsitans TaxID=37546 RepID=A0A1B0G7B8_GLOMM